MIFASLTLSMTFWTAFVLFFTIYIECRKNFSKVLREENPTLWMECAQSQAGAERINPDKIFMSFMRKGDFRSLNHPRTSRIAFWTGISGTLAGISTSALFWYYTLYLPYLPHK